MDVSAVGRADDAFIAAAAAASDADVEWADGYFTRRLRQLTAAERMMSGLGGGSSTVADANAAPRTGQHWLVLDGPMDAAWEEGLYGALR